MIVSRRTLLTASLSAAIVVTTSACAGPSTGTATNGAMVDVPTFTAALDEPGTVVLDVRTPEEFASGHLEGAINLDVESADFRAKLGQLAKDVPYAIYCRSGNRSGTAVELMVADGFTRAFHLRGGIGAWAASGRPVVTG